MAPLPGPPGNNGDFQVDGPPYDPEHKPSNEPHIDGCELQLDFYNYDLGQSALVSFTDSAPTQDGGVIAAGPAVVFVGEDGSGGADFDGAATYTLAFTGTPARNQGFHVRITVTVDGQSKYKEIFVEGCSATPPTTTTTSTTAPTETTDTTDITTAPTETTDTTTATTSTTDTTSTAETTTATMSTTDTTDTTTDTTNTTTATSSATDTTSGSTTSTASTTSSTSAATGSTGAGPSTDGPEVVVDPGSSPDGGYPATTHLDSLRPLATPQWHTAAQPSAGDPPAADPPTAVNAGLAEGTPVAISPSSRATAHHWVALLGMGSGLTLAGTAVLARPRRRTRDAA